LTHAGQVIFKNPKSHRFKYRQAISTTYSQSSGTAARLLAAEWALIALKWHWSKWTNCE